ncbi:MAG: hypothetical protein ACXV2G_05535 [Actinomycetes bacterium]
MISTEMISAVPTMPGSSRRKDFFRGFAYRDGAGRDEAGRAAAGGLGGVCSDLAAGGPGTWPLWVAGLGSGPPPACPL